MSKKRTFDIFEDSHNFKEVHVPFKKGIRAGHHTFTINVPSSYVNREFFFSSIVLMPDFYSIEAEKENLDNDDVLDTPIEYEIAFNTAFLASPAFFTNTYQCPSSITLTKDIVKDFNNHFETTKPTGTVRTSVFYDWIDLRFDGNFQTEWDQYVQVEMALVYYNKPYNASEHFNALPLSARSVHGANNYLMPTIMSDENREHFRFRLVQAPSVDVIFSTEVPMTSMGFNAQQMGDITGKKQYEILNEDISRFQITTAADEFDDKFSKKSIFKVSLRNHSKIYASQSILVRLTKEESFKNVNYLAMLKTAFETLSYESNLQLDLVYSAKQETFSFVFPVNNSIARSNLIVPTDLAARLGFGLVTAINSSNKDGDPVSQSIDISHTESKARALGYDTGVVIVSDANSPSNTTAGIPDKFMCSLYPTATGTFEISLLENCFKPPTTPLPKFHSSGTGYIPATFNLSRYLDNDELVNLEWKNGAFVSGLLRGTRPKSKKE